MQIIIAPIPRDVGDQATAEEMILVFGVIIWLIGSVAWFLLIYYLMSKHNSMLGM